MPAEWEPHRATWISWPHHEPDWPGKLGPIPWVYAEIARVLADHETVEILCHNDDGARRRATRSTRTASGAIASVSTSSRPIACGCATRRRRASIDAAGDVVAVLGLQRLGEVRQLAAGRAGRPADRRRRWPAASRSRAAPTPASASCSRAAASTSTAQGLLLVTEEWLLSDVQVRNPGLTRADYEAIFRNGWASRQTLWLGEGCVGDDTHGHVDDIARFVGADTIVLAVEEDPRRRQPPALDRQSAAAGARGARRRRRAAARRDAAVPAAGDR